MRARELGITIGTGRPGRPAAPQRGRLEPAGGGGDLGWDPERHRRHARAPRARGRGDRGGHAGTGPGEQRRRGHGHDLPRLQGWHRHRVPGARRGESTPTRGGSIIIVAATDAPLLPHQCDRLAQRAGLGVARVGGAGEDSSGDIFLAFATGNRGLAGGQLTVPLEMLAGERIDPLFYAVIEATEEAIVNAMVAAETMTGRGGATAHRLDPDRLRGVMDRYRPGPGR